MGVQHWSEVLQRDSRILLLEQKDLGKLCVTPHRKSSQVFRPKEFTGHERHMPCSLQVTKHFQKTLKLNTYSKRPKAAAMKAMRHRTQEAPSLTCPIFSYSQMLLRSRLVPVLHRRSTTSITSVRSGNWRKILS